MDTETRCLKIILYISISKFLNANEAQMNVEC